MDLNDKIEALGKLGEVLASKPKELTDLYNLAERKNGWFVKENIERAIDNIVTHYLDRAALQNWTSQYEFNKVKPLKVGLILAGNIPLVGFHDLLCCFLSGHISNYKLSDKDSVIYPFIFKTLQEIDARTTDSFMSVERLNDIDALIATGSDNSAKHFEYYFRKKKKILRRNRNGVGVLRTEDGAEEIKKMGRDVFDYFGLGCRNVSKVYFPKGYDLTQFMEIIHENYKELINHNKYKNNYDYNYATYLLNDDKFLMSGSLILREDASLLSRIACLHYEFYENDKSLIEELKGKKDQIQCIVCSEKLDDLETLALGTSQEPRLDQYADGVDTMNFLLSL